MSLDISRDVENQKFISRVNDLQCYLEYEYLDANKLDYTYTFVPQDLRHKGVGHQLVEEALDYAKNQGFKVKASCPFVKSVVEENKDAYSSLMI